MHAGVGDDRGHERGGGDVERGVVHGDVGRGERESVQRAHLVGGALLDLDRVAVGGGGVDRAPRRGDDERLARLVQSSEDFDQIERATIFLENFPKSSLRPAMLLLFGDLIEEAAATLAREAARRLNRREMSATGAPLHSFYLNYTSLDRYRRLGVNFVFNPNTKMLHYDGASWREIIAKFPKSTEAAEAQKRLDSLKEKMERKP